MPLLADIAAHGLGRALESGRADHERRSIVQAWIAAGTREEPANTATRSAHPRSGNSSPGATVPMSGSIWPSSSSSTTYRLMGSSRSLRILPARLMLPSRPSKSAIFGSDANGPARWSARDKRPQVRPQATSVLPLRSQAPRPAAALAGAGHDEAFRGGAHDPARRSGRRRTPRRESPGGNSHPSASRPPRDGRNSGSPRADLYPWLTGRDRVTVMASLARVGKDARGRG